MLSLFLNEFDLENAYPNLIFLFTNKNIMHGRVKMYVMR